MSALTRERPAILSGTQVSVNFRGLKALQQVDIRVPEGAITGLVGPNGAGKSTLLGVLSGDVVAQQGTVRLGGKDVSGLTPEARVRHGLARTFQLPQLFDELTVREHLTLPRRLAQAPSRAWSDPLTGRFLQPDVAEDHEVDALLASLGLEHVAGTPAGALPLGLSRLVEIARATATHPKVILLDEPTTGVDPVSRRDFWRILYQLVAEGVAILTSTAYLDEAERCHRVALLHEGKLLFCDTPANLKAKLGKGVLSITSSDPRRLREEIEKAEGISSLVLTGDGIHLVVDNASRRIPEFEQSLKNAGVPFTAVQQVTPTIEDLFVDAVTEQSREARHA